MKATDNTARPEAVNGGIAAADHLACSGVMVHKYDPPLKYRPGKGNVFWVGHPPFPWKATSQYDVEITWIEDD